MFPSGAAAAAVRMSFSLPAFLHEKIPAFVFRHRVGRRQQRFSPAGAASMHPTATTTTTTTANSRKRRRLKLLALDFDLTLTAADTTELGALLPRNNADDDNRRKEEEERAAAWRTLVEAYAEDMKASSSSSSPTSMSSSPVSRAEAAAALRVAAARQREADVRSMERIEAAGVFCGLRRHQLYAAGRSVPLHSEALRAAAAAASSGVKVAIVSLNWSADVIKGAIGEAFPFELWCNDMEFDDETGLSTGRLGRVVVDAIDKQRCLLSLCGCNDGAVAYVGDSASDLLAMLAADIGIIVGDSQSMRRACASVRIEVASITELLPALESDAAAAHTTRAEEATQDRSSMPARVYEAKNWGDISTALGLEELAAPLRA
eukprot:jgi/Chlat1/6733/Chrsp50S09099